MAEARKKLKPPPRGGWRVGMRVKGGSEETRGTIVEVGRGFIRIKWDNCPRPVFVEMGSNGRNWIGEMMGAYEDR